jgi:hypothetical protein
MIAKLRKVVDLRFFFGFWIVELLLLTALKIVEIMDPETLIRIYIMFTAILLNAVFMLCAVLRLKKQGRDIALMGIPLAVFTTLLADLFLVLLKELGGAKIVTFITYEAAMMIGFFIFGLVQVVYAAYLKPNKWRILIRVGFYIAFIVAIYAAGLLTLDRFIACLSMSQLILNLVYVWIDHGRARTTASLVLAIGITLFFACDLFIMVRMLLSPASALYPIIVFMVWMFYIPSQALLSTAYLVDRAEA